MRSAMGKRWAPHIGALVVLGLVARMGVGAEHTAAQAPGPPPHSFFGSRAPDRGSGSMGRRRPMGPSFRAERWDDRELVATDVVDDGAWLIKISPDLSDQVVLTVKGFSAAGLFDVVFGVVTEVALDLLSNGDGVWIRVRQDVVWEQPPR